MVLLLLVVLAVLIWLIQVESEPERHTVESVWICCPACQRSVDMDSMVCPHCKQQLREACSDCHRGKIINHRYCPFCGAEKR